VALAMIDELNLLGICPDSEKCQAYINAVATVLNELAQEGNIVIVGRGGQVVLKDCMDVLHVRVIAPMETRIARVAAIRKVSSSAAIAQIQTSDRTHRQYFQRFYQTQWEDPTLYDLTINSGRISISAAAKIICGCLTLPDSMLKRSPQSTEVPRD
jgi:cytidylate kinase